MGDLEVCKERDGDEASEGLEGEGGEGDDEEANVSPDAEPGGGWRERTAEGGLVACSHVRDEQRAEQGGRQHDPGGGVEAGGEREPGEEGGVRDAVEDSITESAGR